MFLWKFHEVVLNDKSSVKIFYETDITEEALDQFLCLFEDYLKSMGKTPNDY